MKQKNFPIIFGIVLLCLIGGYLFWRNCIVPLRSERSGRDLLERYTAPAGGEEAVHVVPDSVYLYFSDSGARLKSSQYVRMPEKIFSQRPVRLSFSIRQSNISSIGMRYITIAFSVNTEIYSGEIDGTSWQSSGRQDVHEYFYVINKIILPGEDIDLPYLDVAFRTPGSYEMEYCIIIEGHEAVQGKGLFEVI